MPTSGNSSNGNSSSAAAAAAMAGPASNMVRTVGYLVTGAIFSIVGGVLIAVATASAPKVADLNSPEDFRDALSDDRNRAAKFGSGVALLTTGFLMFFGFGLLEIIIGLVVKRRTAQAAKAAAKAAAKI